MKISRYVEVLKDLSCYLGIICPIKNEIKEVFAIGTESAVHISVSFKCLLQASYIASRLHYSSSCVPYTYYCGGDWIMSDRVQAHFPEINEITITITVFVRTSRAIKPLLSGLGCRVQVHMVNYRWIGFSVMVSWKSLVNVENIAI